jgi:dTMP kinase
MSGYFVTIEGGDGSGKSTLIQRIKSDWTGRGLKYVSTREPGGTPAAEEIRNLLLRPASDGAGATITSPMAELFLYEAARAEHVESFIRPALGRGEHVLCDRFTYSTLAYQGAARGLGIDLVRQMNQAACGGLEPNLVVWLKINIETAKRRSVQRGSENRLDGEKAAFHQKVYDAFLKMAADEPSRFIVLDAEQSPDQVYSQLVSHPLWNKHFGASR